MAKKKSAGTWTPRPGATTARVRKPGQFAQQGKHGQGCCAMAAGVRAARRGKYRLAGRYAAMGVRVIAARVTA